jgi:glycosyltransferase involved in cell wall biosynthesis
MPASNSTMGAKRHNLCLFCWCFGHGGTEHQFVEIVTRLNREKYNVTVACLRRDGVFYDQICDSGLPVAEFPQRGSLARTAQSAWEWMRFLKREKIELVHTFDFYTNVFGAPLARLARVPVVLTSRRDLGDMWSRPKQVALRRAFHWSHGVIANSDAAGRGLVEGERVPESRVRVVRNGVDLARYSSNGHRAQKREELGYSSDNLVVGTVSNLRREKDHRTMIEAAAIIVKRVPQSRFFIAGTGELEGELKALVQQRGLVPYFSFLGKRADVPELLGAMDVMVLPSSSESLPNIVLEAMSCGRPVVASDTGGLSGLIDSGRTGQLVPSRSPQVLADSIAQLLEQPAMREQMGRAARQHAEAEFDIHVAVKRLEAIYDDFLEKRAEAR